MTDELIALRAENQRLRAEMDALRSGDRAHTIVGLADIVITLSPSGRISYFNAAAEKHYAVVRNDVLGLPIDALTSPALDGKLLKQLADEAKTTAGTLVREVKSSEKSDERILEIRVSPLPDGAQMLISDKSEIKRLQVALGRYLSPSVLDTVNRTGVDPYKPRRYELSVLFADLRDFTKVAAEQPPADVKSLLDEYLTVQIEVLFESGATVDKALGDQLLAVFGAPIPSQDHALWSINTALKMRSAHQRLMDVWRRRGMAVCPLAIGIGSGELLVANVGYFKRMDYTVIGSTVGAAAALCDAATAGEIVISPRTFELSKETLTRHPDAIARPVKFRRRDPVTYKGAPIEAISVAEAV